MIDANDAQRQVVAALGKLYGPGRLAESGVDVVDGDGVMRVGGVAGDVADDAQATGLGGERLGVDEGGDLGGEVYAVDEDVRLDDLLVGAGLGRGFGEVPLLLGVVSEVKWEDAFGLVVTYDDVFETGTNTEVDGATTATTQSANNEDARVVAGLGLALLDSLLDVFNEEVLVFVARDTGKRLVLAVLELPCPSQESESSTSETGVVAKRSNTPTVLIFKELKVEKSAVSLVETTENGIPATLVLVAVCELDMSVLQGEVLLGELLEANDDVVLGNVGPRSSRDERSTSALVLGVREDAQRRTLDIDRVASINELLRNRRRNGRTVLEGLGLGPDVKDI